MLNDPNRDAKPRGRAIKDAGLRALFAKRTKTQIADALGISVAAVSQWERVPRDRVNQLARMTGLSRTILRDDLYPRSFRSVKEDHAS